MIPQLRGHQADFVNMDASSKPLELIFELCRTHCTLGASVP